jgi:hypothetical protein
MKPILGGISARIIKKATLFNMFYKACRTIDKSIFAMFHFCVCVFLYVGCATRHGRGKNENLFDKKYFSTFGKSVVINPGQSIGC